MNTFVRTFKREVRIVVSETQPESDDSFALS